MSQQKILHILYSGLGGHGNVFFSIVKGDKQQVFYTEALFCGIEEVQPDYVRKCESLHIPYTFFKKSPGLDMPTLRRIYGLLKKNKPDTVFLHGPTLILPVIAYKIFSGRKRIVVRDTQAHHLKTKKEWVFLALAGLFANRLVFLTQEAKEGAVKKLKLPFLFRRTNIIPNGLDTDIYKPVPARNIDQAVVIGMQSRLQRIKDHPVLLKAFARLKAEIPGRHLKLRIAGDGETMAELKELATSLNIAADVDFCGMLPEKDLVDFMQSLDIYVHATHGETMSNSIMQAMACGLPSVVSDVWGVNNMVTHGENAMLYTPGDAGALCHYIKDILEHGELRTKLSLNARHHAEKEFSLERLFLNYQPLLQG